MEDEKHGIYITPHKKGTDTKKIYRYGHLMATYRHQPRNLLFQSDMVNDDNQDLCGGWTPLAFGRDRGGATTNILILKQVVEGRKPLGILNVDSKREADGVVQDIHRYHPDLKTRAIPTRYGYRIGVAQDETLRDLFDLADLYTDYLESGVMSKQDLDLEFDEYADRTLISFTGGFDVEDVPPWVTGLILGYPIENTISLYREDRV